MRAVHVPKRRWGALQRPKAAAAAPRQAGVPLAQMYEENYPTKPAASDLTVVTRPLAPPLVEGWLYRKAKVSFEKGWCALFVKPV